MKRFRLSTLMLLIVIAALGTALVMQQRRAARREAELQARLAQSWPLFLKQQREDTQMRLLVEAMQKKHRAELAKRSEAEARQQEREDAEINRDIEAMQQRYREEAAKRELAKRSDAEAQRQPK
jgi:colicin import membrane protein